MSSRRRAGGLSPFSNNANRRIWRSYAIGKMMLNSQYLNTKREVAFYEWLRERRREAGVQSNPG